ncbi:MAG: LAGLIDADG family homing endonuclease [Candidatus Aenigmarchaeota archaeon]|nr:LAGLIDADG family homing endonuclease [Candidatus Aenigmarchaeota archaeon]
MVKLTSDILESATNFYLNDNSVNETTKFILQEYDIKISYGGLRKQLKKLGIVRDNITAIKISKRKHLPINKIIELYTEKLISLKKLAKMFHSSKRTIHKILEENDIAVRNQDEGIRLANTKHTKLPFDGDVNEKAYLIGLVRGDLTPLKKSKYTLRLTTGSTHPLFLQLLQTLFKKYGPSYIYPVRDKISGYQWRIGIELDMASFNFLLEGKKKINNLWSDKNSFLHFLAGIIDSDGSVYIRKTGKYVQYIVRVFGQDVKLLEEIRKSFNLMGFNPILYISSKKGETRNHMKSVITYNKDYYILELCRKEDVRRLLKILPLRHPERIARKEIMLDLERKGVIYHKDTEKMIKLRGKIKGSTKDFIKKAEIEYKKRNDINHPLQHPRGVSLHTLGETPAP